MAPEVPVFAVGETINVAVSFANILDVGELLTGVPTIVELTTSDLTFANERVNTATFIFDNHTGGVGKVIQFKMSGQLVDKTYVVKITCSTDSTPAQIKVRGITFTVEDVE